MAKEHSVPAFPRDDDKNHIRRATNGLLEDGCWYTYSQYRRQLEDYLAGRTALPVYIVLSLPLQSPSRSCHFRFHWRHHQRKSPHRHNHAAHYTWTLLKGGGGVSILIFQT